ncbi:UNVERIFIED_CONTAM: hypothetical protein K2H54_015256 [Gekko kuhli]
MAASSLEQKLSRLEAKLKQENREARRRIDLNLEISPARARPTSFCTIHWVSTLPNPGISEQKHCVVDRSISVTVYLKVMDREKVMEANQHSAPLLLGSFLFRKETVADAELQEK